jgi:hypothetical protein
MNTLKHSIHPFEFLQSAKFAECWFPADITELVKDELKDVHPSMFIGDNISFMLFKVTYSYSTNRGNFRKSCKYIFLNAYEGLDEFEASIMAESRFQLWVDDFNIDYPFRAISNVQILEIVPYANASLLVG